MTTAGACFTPVFSAALIFASLIAFCSAEAESLSVAGTPPAGSAPPSARPVLIIDNDFHRTAGAEWLSDSLAWTPDRHERFLGEFDTTGVIAMTARTLPPHTWLRIVFDLYILKSWDGNTVSDPWGNVIGPDIWEASLDNGPVLIRTSFALFTRDGGRQAFPDEFPGGNYPHNTGATAINTLGFAFEGREMNAVYHFDLAVPHIGDSVRLNFRSSGPAQGTGDESWGLDNFRLEAWPEPPGRDLDAAALEAACRDLSAVNPVRAFDAAWKLTAAGDRVVPLLRKHLEPPAPDAKQVQRWIARLDHPAYAVRQGAAERLLEMGPGIEPLLRAALSTPLTLETHAQITAILARFEDNGLANPVALRYTRAIRLLELLGSPIAADVLKELAAQAPTLAARKAAQAAGERIEKRGRKLR